MRAVHVADVHEDGSGYLRAWYDLSDDQIAQVLALLGEPDSEVCASPRAMDAMAEAGNRELSELRTEIP